MLTSGIFSLVLLGTSGLLLDSHRRAWRAVCQNSSTSDSERNFGRRQYVRRMMASGIIGLVGIVIGLGPLVPAQPAPLAIYVLVLLSACCWLMILALVDAWATRHHFRQKRGQFRAEELELVHELKEARQSQRAGTADDSAGSRCR
jgi:hypothetical protein